MERTVTRRRVWGAVVVVVVLLALALTPPLLNANRLKRRIAASMSASLGRPVHLDSVTMHLLPVPGFTLGSVVVSEDPAFGDEPTLRADSVEIRLRVSSLWRRQVELSSIQFVEPSLNLVRNAQGKWNLQGLLMHAASVETAPTVQTKAGPAPRFPYVEATGGRVNLKLGDEKTPYSLTETDFALWQPEPGRFRVRLEGKPARTDRNISDPGVVRVEGSVERAGAMGDVPVDLTASWQEAPLGEASKLLHGEDAYWRGKLSAEATLKGKLGAAALKTNVHLRDLRRADFVPVHTLDVDVDCAATADVTAITLRDAVCSMPMSGAGPAVVKSAMVDLSTPASAVLSADAKALPVSWLMEWARLFSSRVPAELQTEGSVDAHFERDGAKTGWQGSAVVTLPSLPVADGKAAAEATSKFTFEAVPEAADGLRLVLLPTRIETSAATVMTVSGAVWSDQELKGGYSLSVEGEASAAQVWVAPRYLPPLGDGLDVVANSIQSGPYGLQTIKFRCERAWGGTQKCAAVSEPVKKRKR
jgi:AsmA protein